MFSNTLKQLQTLVKSFLQQFGDCIKLHYFVLDGYFGHNNALQMVRQSGLHLISKLRTDAALCYPPTIPYKGRGRRAIYVDRFNPHQMENKNHTCYYLVLTQYWLL